MNRSSILRPKGTLATKEAKRIARSEVVRIVSSLRVSIMYLTDHEADADTIASCKLALDSMIDAKAKLEGQG
jgi:hypothetical protein